MTVCGFVKYGEPSVCSPGSRSTRRFAQTELGLYISRNEAGMSPDGTRLNC